MTESESRSQSGNGAGAAALIVAAGHGERFGAGLPKQYRRLGGVPILTRSIRTFLGSPEIDRVLVAIHPDHRALYDEAVAGLELPEPALGGATRQDSVRRGLELLASDPPRHVVIHDAVRPLVGARTIARTLAALADSAGAVAATPARDTLKRVAEGRIVETVPRGAVWHAQTPQAFRFSEILAAHREATDIALTDDASVAERAGLRVAAVESDADNVKITTENDLALAERSLPRQVRVGNGFDVHRFAAAGDHVMLCGLAIPHDRGLAGHSDADVALHAVVDAMLGAVAAGDIGTFFPPDDQTWAGADSAVFVRRARELVTAAGGRLSHIDLTIICEAPRIAPCRDAMRTNLSALLDLPASAVSVKATTTEGLGFAGRGEGIAAQATATVETVA